MTKDVSIRPNSLVILLTEAVKDEQRARLVLERVEKDDMTTSWGIRSLSSLDHKYHPSLYHDGAVWPLVTGWAAISEIKSQRTQHAMEYLSVMADRIISENGMYAETYRGDRPEPFNSCILQAWSVGLYVYALRELMLGIKPNMIFFPVITFISKGLISQFIYFFPRSKKTAAFTYEIFGSRIQL